MEKVDFQCRVCGCTEYSFTQPDNFVFGPGARSRIEYYYCLGCSVVFKDIEKFSVSTKKEKEED